MSDRLIGLLFGFAFLITGILYHRFWSKRRKNWVKSTGTVIRVSPVADNAWRTFEYFVDGKQYTSRASTNGFIGEIGSEVDIYFNPERPEKADIDSGIQNFIFSYCFMIAGLGVMLISYFNLWD